MVIFHSYVKLPEGTPVAGDNYSSKEISEIPPIARWSIDVYFMKNPPPKNMDDLGVPAWKPPYLDDMMTL